MFNAPAPPVRPDPKCTCTTTSVELCAMHGGPCVTVKTNSHGGVLAAAGGAALTLIGLALFTGKKKRRR